MARLVRSKKNAARAESDNADPETLASPTLDSPRPPRVSLPHVETRLNMHQYNGLFDVNSPECQKATIAVETSPGRPFHLISAWRYLKLASLFKF